MMNHSDEWMSGWMGGGMWIWTVIGVLVVVLLARGHMGHMGGHEPEGGPPAISQKVKDPVCGMEIDKDQAFGMTQKWGKQMLNTVVVLSLPLFLLSPAYAQEKIVDNIAVELGVISWTDIEKELKGKPKTHTEEYHIKMAKKMAAMHGGGVKDEYHILIVLIDRSSNTHIGDAHVEVTAKAKTGLEQVTHKLQPMTMNNFSGYGKYFGLSYHVPYIFEVKFSLKGQEKVYTVEFERSP